VDGLLREFKKAFDWQRVDVSIGAVPHSECDAFHLLASFIDSGAQSMAEGKSHTLMIDRFAASSGDATPY